MLSNGKSKNLGGRANLQKWGTPFEPMVVFQPFILWENVMEVMTKIEKTNTWGTTKTETN